MSKHEQVRQQIEETLIDVYPEITRVEIEINLLGKYKNKDPNIKHITVVIKEKINEFSYPCIVNLEKQQINVLTLLNFFGWEKHKFNKKVQQLIIDLFTN
ncbi:hypothetical protein [Crocosphaera sp.]|uniref:hypothetical protein n=1 Tax=Crocosphaera sp. TaxID=2729996 RepID=UPI00262EB870|nr:hypothetical protein [Crocosphaera sp.]MDJ0579655.1 hypothetical protein [Crocosphaera sp.]